MLVEREIITGKMVSMKTRGSELQFPGSRAVFPSGRTTGVEDVTKQYCLLQVPFVGSLRPLSSFLNTCFVFPGKMSVLDQISCGFPCREALGG